MADTSFTGCIWIVWRICRTSLYTCPSRIVCKPVIWTWSNTFLITIDRIISKIPKRTSSYTWHSSAIFVSLNWTGTIFKTISWCLISIITIRASSYLNTFSQKVISKIVVRAITYTWFSCFINIVIRSCRIRTYTHTLSIVRVSDIRTC